ncbi:flavin reductase [Spongiactinospora rosea]|uniref:Flavin reductase n=1 Tax=Spongiactinospora rosea TaxID=2248750 RepID=A0A366M1N2_9ACTN|nr:flavin reductase family protein [Spongiactinospora rosea]RBQ20091.1 flavin reductase [Spongiactinospora rosea]
MSADRPQSGLVSVRFSAGVADGCVDDDAFLAIMSAFPSGVTAVSTLDEHDQPVGLTCSAACSVSKSPPLLLVCIHNASRVLRSILDRELFLVNFLRDHREHISSLFASGADDRFTEIVWRPSRGAGLPWMPLDTIAYAECRVVHALRAGDHTIVIGAIVDGGHMGDELGPLMYWRRRYGRWPIEDDPVVAATTLAAEG